MRENSPRRASGPRQLTLPPLYPIIDVDLCQMRGVDPRALAAGCFAGGARFLQVRQKSAGSGSLVALARAILSLAQPAGATVLLNDRADLAVIAGAAGVHVGQQDLPVAAVRSIAGPDAIVGVSTHTRPQVDEALESSADYIAVGPIFQTSTKDTGYEPRGLDLLRYAAGRGKPVVAIGGITLATAPEVIAAGAASVAVISDLMAAGDVSGRVRRYLMAAGG